LKKLLIILTLLSIFFSASASYDRNIIQHLPHVDQQRWHFGFILGLGFGDFSTVPNDSYVDAKGNKWYAKSAGMSPAFNVGMIADLRLCNYLNLRCTPSLNLGQKNLNYTSFSKDGKVVGEVSKVVTQYTSIEIPFYLKYSAKRYGNVRPYIIAGGGPFFNLNLNPEQTLLLNAFDVQIAFGIGIEIYNQYFKFCPEIKFGFGLLDQLNQNHPEIEGTAYEPYTRAIEKLTSRMLTITFNFE
jgi:hypothetical protein